MGGVARIIENKTGSFFARKYRITKFLAGIPMMMIILWILYRQPQELGLWKLKYIVHVLIFCWLFLCLGNSESHSKVFLLFKTNPDGVHRLVFVIHLNFVGWQDWQELSTIENMCLEIGDARRLSSKSIAVLIRNYFGKHHELRTNSSSVQRSI